jgi:hypothetical protein
MLRHIDRSIRKTGFLRQHAIENTTVVTITLKPRKHSNTPRGRWLRLSMSENFYINHNLTAQRLIESRGNAMNSYK